MNISNLNKVQKVNLNHKLSSNKKNIATSKFIALSDTGYISYINEGWSSRIAFFNSSGKEVMSVFAPGLGKVSGLAFTKGNIWIVSDLGNNKKGIIRKYLLSPEKITEMEVIELPILNPKGLAIGEEDCFYTYSEQSKEIVKLKIKNQ
jgi:hypothetical protein